MDTNETTSVTLLDVYRDHTSDLTWVQKLVLDAHLLGGLAAAVEKLTGGPEAFLGCLEDATQFTAQLGLFASQASLYATRVEPLTTRLEQAARQEAKS